jgi:hypothetical protein
VRGSPDHKRIWVYAENLSGTDIVSFSLYPLEGARLARSPSCQVLTYCRVGATAWRRSSYAAILGTCR